MYKLGNTYIGKHGIYNTAPVKQVNPTRWASISLVLYNCLAGAPTVQARLILLCLRACIILCINV